MQNANSSTIRNSQKNSQFKINDTINKARLNGSNKIYNNQFILPLILAMGLTFSICNCQDQQDKDDQGAQDNQFFRYYRKRQYVNNRYYESFHCCDQLFTPRDDNNTKQKQQDDNFSFPNESTYRPFKIHTVDWFTYNNRDKTSQKDEKYNIQMKQFDQDLKNSWSQLQIQHNFDSKQIQDPQVSVQGNIIHIRCPLNVNMNSFSHMQLVKIISNSLANASSSYGNNQTNNISIDIQDNNFLKQYSIQSKGQQGQNSDSLRVDILLPRKTKQFPGSQVDTYQQGQTPEILISFPVQECGVQKLQAIEKVLEQYVVNLSKPQNQQQMSGNLQDQQGRGLPRFFLDNDNDDLDMDPFKLLSRQIQELDKQFQQFESQGPFGGFHQFGMFGNSGDSEDSMYDDDDGQFYIQSFQNFNQPGQDQNAQNGMAYNSQDQQTKQLQKLGAKIYFPEEGNNKINWGVLAGYEDQKQLIEESILLPLNHPEIFDKVAKKTRLKFQANRPRAILFEGPPGTGKTTSARVISTQAALPLVYIPLESIMSKWYGEAEKNLAKIFEVCEKMGGCIVFLDEIDSLATSRGSDMHEATRRLLGVLLRWIDGFEGQRKTLVIGATNRKEDLDNALISRFDTIINFGVPDKDCRKQIISHYAQHLSSKQLEQLAENSDGLSGRDLRDVCEVTERAWAAKIIKGTTKEDTPSLDEYLKNIQQRQQIIKPKQRLKNLLI